jgi:hypothetical protein
MIEHGLRGSLAQTIDGGNREHAAGIVDQCQRAGVPMWCDDLDIREVPN